MSDCVKFVEECSVQVTVWKADWDRDIKITEIPMRGKNHWFWGLSNQDQEFCDTIGEASFLHHKHIIAKALKNHV